MDLRRYQSVTVYLFIGPDPIRSDSGGGKFIPSVIVRRNRHGRPRWIPEAQPGREWFCRPLLGLSAVPVLTACTVAVIRIP